MGAKTIKSKTDLKKSLAAQEVAFAKILAGNDAKQRHRAVKKLRLWLRTRSNGNSEFSEDEFVRIWTGLFYCMWMSDKFLVQEELAESLSQLIHCFEEKKNAAILFVKAFNKILTVEWSGLDQYRIDKFAMLVRRFLRQNLEYCRKKNWDPALLNQLMNIYKTFVLVPNKCVGYTLHFIEIYLEEFAKVSKGQVDTDIVISAVEPFVKLLSLARDVRVQKALKEFFIHLMKQTDVGIESEEKFQAWKAQGFPGKSADSLELVSDESENDDLDNEVFEGESGGDGDDDDDDSDKEDKPLDPRAGQVDVELPQIPVDANGMIELFKKYLNLKTTTVKGRKSLRWLIQQFECLSRGKFLLTIKKDPILDEIPKKQKRKSMVEKSARELLKFEEKLDEILESKGKMIKPLITDPDQFDEEEIEESVEEDVDTEEDEDEDEDKETIEEREESLEKSFDTPKRQHVNNSDRKKGKRKNKKAKAIRSPEDIDEKQQSRINIPHKKAKIENVEKNSPNSKLNGSVIRNGKKRKILGDWQVHEIDSNSPEYVAIKLPKIIKLEKKIDALECQEKMEPAGSESNEEPENEKAKENQNGDLHVFWETAKNKLNKKNKTPKKSLVSDSIIESERVEKPHGSKRISFALHRNMAQENEEYLEEVKNSPKVPFDGSRKPIASALKSGLSPSPINPFYRLKKK